MGEVYLAEDQKLHRKVAFKILPDDVATNRDRMHLARSHAAVNQRPNGQAPSWLILGAPRNRTEKRAA